MVRASAALIAAPIIVVLGVTSLLAGNAALAADDAEMGPGGLGAALSRTPTDATLHEQFALAQARSASSADESRGALAHAVRALELRPVSSYGWAAFAEVKYRADVADATFQAALQRASELGPYEPAVQQAVVFYGLGIWDDAAPQTRAAIDRMLATGMKVDAPAMMQIAQRRGRLDAACRHVGTSRIPANWAQLCKQMGEK